MASKNESLSWLGYFCLCFMKYADFSGRARRKEYWSFVLCEVIVLSFLMASTFIFSADWIVLSLALSVWAAVSLLPGLAVAVRRLHDVSLSGALAYVWFVFVCWLVCWSACLSSFIWILDESVFWMLFTWNLILFGLLLLPLCMNGTRGDNKYGPDPKI